MLEFFVQYSLVQAIYSPMSYITNHGATPLILRHAMLICVESNNGNAWGRQMGIQTKATTVKLRVYTIYP